MIWRIFVYLANILQWPGIWTMGNLGRPGYGSTTDGTWPYTYDSCDVGTFPNQTYANGSGPAAALQTDEGRSKYNFELSWLPGQKLSCVNALNPFLSALY